MGPLKQLQQSTLGAAGAQTPDAGVLYNAAHAATFEDISGSSTLPQSELAMQSNATQNMEVNPGAVPVDEMNPGSPMAQKKGIIKKTIEKVKKNRAEKKASKEAYDAAKEKGGGIFDMR
tara:strand:+ start:1045 stop:1401 length:357 start_codon:yes stop_codon:yes gene_type:complete